MLEVEACWPTLVLLVYSRIYLFILILHISERGSQLVSAATLNPELEVPNYDFDVVSKKTKTAWYFTPAQA